MEHGDDEILMDALQHIVDLSNKMSCVAQDVQQNGCDEAWRYDVVDEENADDELMEDDE